jgi:hypothetical protein
VPSRWPFRLAAAAFISFFTSVSVRYSRARVSALGRRWGGWRVLTVPIMVAGATSAKCGFAMEMLLFSTCSVPLIAPHGTDCKANQLG